MWGRCVVRRCVGGCVWGTALWVGGLCGGALCVAGRCAWWGAPVMSWSVAACTLESFFVIARFSDLSLQP